MDLRELTKNDLNLSPEQQKILETPVALYAYLKEKYGITSTEIEKPNDSILISCSIDLSTLLPEAYLPLHEWQIHLEHGDNKDNKTNSIRFIFGEVFPKEDTCWSRVYEIQGSTHNPGGKSKIYARCRYAVIENNLFEKEYLPEFNTVQVFTSILLDFIKQY